MIPQGLKPRIVAERVYVGTKVPTQVGRSGRLGHSSRYAKEQIFGLARRTKSS